MHMHTRFHGTLTGMVLAGCLACGGGGDETTSAGATEASTGGTGASEGSGSTGSPTTDPTTSGASQSGTETSASTGPSGSTADPTTGAGESDTGPATVPDTDPGTGTSETTGTTVDPDTGETGAPSLCPPEPNDSDCAICTKTRCCDELLACQEDEVCGCFSGCLAMGGTPMECGMQCMANPMMNEALMALRLCNQDNCSDLCAMP